MGKLAADQMVEMWKAAEPRKFSVEELQAETAEGVQ
jgi:hypothetical protein